MGWASGSELMGAVIDEAKKCVPAAKRKTFYKNLIRAFEAHDWDTQTECMNIDPIFDKALREINPDIFDDDDQ